MPLWAWVVAGLLTVQTLAVAGAVWLMYPLHRQWRRSGPEQVADASPVVAPAQESPGAHEGLVERLKRPGLADLFRHADLESLQDLSAQGRRPSPRPRRHGDACRCMTCHARSGEAMTKPEHEEIPGLGPTVRQVAIDYCESMLEESA